MASSGICHRNKSQLNCKQRLCDWVKGRSISVSYIFHLHLCTYHVKQYDVFIFVCFSGNYNNSSSGVIVNNNNPDQHVAPESKKRKRTSFTTEQMLKMEEQYQLTPYLTRSARLQLALTLDLDEKQILFWFQNRRMRKKKTTNQAASVNQAAKETSKDEEEEDKAHGRCSNGESSVDVQKKATEDRGEADKIEETIARKQKSNDE